MSDFRHVRKGEKKINARAFNTMLDAARYYQTQLRTSGSPHPGSIQTRYGAAVIYVANISETAVEPGDVMALSEPAILPEDNEAEFIQNLTMKVDVPTSADTGKICVLLDPLPASHEGASSETVYPIGRAVVGGLAAVHLVMADAGDKFADVTDGETFLTSTPTGSARIIWNGSGSSSEWGVVLLTGVDAFECEPTES